MRKKARGVKSLWPSCCLSRTLALRLDCITLYLLATWGKVLFYVFWVIYYTVSLASAPSGRPSDVPSNFEEAYGGKCRVAPSLSAT